MTDRNLGTDEIELSISRNAYLIQIFGPAHGLRISHPRGLVDHCGGSKAIRIGRIKITTFSCMVKVTKYGEGDIYWTWHILRFIDHKDYEELNNLGQSPANHCFESTDRLVFCLRSTGPGVGPSNLIPDNIVIKDSLWMERIRYASISSPCG